MKNKKKVRRELAFESKFVRVNYAESKMVLQSKGSFPDFLKLQS